MSNSDNLRHISFTKQEKRAADSLARKLQGSEHLKVEIAS